MNHPGKVLFAALCAPSLFACHHDKATPTPKHEEPAPSACAAYEAPAGAVTWMSWEDGVDVMGMTEAGLPGPNVIVHVAGMVHTPDGSAPSGLIFYQPDPKGAPEVMGFLSSDPKVAAYFGPNIFAGTPFEQAPALEGEITVTSTDDGITAHAEVGGHSFDVRLSDLADAAPIDRAAGDPMPFSQKGTEAQAKASLEVDGQPVEIVQYADSVSAPCGVYVR